MKHIETPKTQTLTSKSATGCADQRTPTQLSASAVGVATWILESKSRQSLRPQRGHPKQPTSRRAAPIIPRRVDERHQEALGPLPGTCEVSQVDPQHWCALIYIYIFVYFCCRRKQPSTVLLRSAFAAQRRVLLSFNVERHDFRPFNRQRAQFLGTKWAATHAGWSSSSLISYKVRVSHRMTFNSL